MAQHIYNTEIIVDGICNLCYLRTFHRIQQSLTSRRNLYRTFCEFDLQYTLPVMAPKNSP